MRRRCSLRCALLSRSGRRAGATWTAVEGDSRHASCCGAASPPAASRWIGAGCAAVLLVSDGWERDDPALLARELATLQRSCHRLIWLDPLAGRPGFEPVSQGLLAALPHVDEFVPCGNVASLEELAWRLAGWSDRRIA